MNSNSAPASPDSIPAGTTQSQAPVAPEAVAALPTPSARHPWRSRAIIALLLVGLAAGIWLTIPIVSTALNTISTDDAYVNGHVTFVAPRVSGQVLRVLVDDNYRVKKGDPIVELDPEPYQAIVNVKQANLDSAEADFFAAVAQVRALFAQLRGQRWKLQATIEGVNNQVAILNARVAALGSKKATLDRAKADLGRAKDAFARNANSKADLDQANEAVKVAQALVDQALQEVYESRVFLGQPQEPPSGNLTEVPKDLNQTFSSVRQSLADVAQLIAQVGLPLARSEATPNEAIDEFKKQDDGNIDHIIQNLIPKSPAVKQSQAKLAQAKRDLEQAQLNLKYCKVYAEIDGVVTRRNVNPGNNVQIAQQLMAIRSLTEIWIDANYKETQIADLTIGQRVELFADAYGQRHKYVGRITGFTYGTGSTLALLPPQNATGNFVKVVQRLPVRIELESYDPEKDFPLYAGLSVTPYVYYKDEPKGPDAGKRLQDIQRSGASAGSRP